MMVTACAAPPRPPVAPPAPRKSQVARIHYEAGQKLFGQGDYLSAIESYQRAIDADERFGLAYLDMAEARLYVDGDYAAMRVLLEKAVALLPSSPRAHSRLADVLLALDEVEPAIERWRYALSLRPSMVESRLQLATALARLGKIDKARRQLEEAVRWAPRNVQARVRLGQIYADARRFGDAAVQVEIAAEVGGRSAALYRRAATFYDSAGRGDLAVKLRGKADVIDPPAKQRRFRPLKKRKRRKKRR